MNIERWKRIESIYLAALERSPAERDTFVRQATDDPTIGEEVLNMLSVTERGKRLDVETWLIGRGDADAGASK